jgi:transcriptional regulator GlxA family with amidase domain
MKVSVLALDDVFDLGLAAVLDAFRTANELIPAAGLNIPPFDLRVVGVRARVRTAQGLRVPVQHTGSWAADCIVVPAIGFKMPGPLETALRRPDVREAVAAIREHSATSKWTAAACIGTFVLAESGALAGQTATTTWWLSALFRQRYPDVRLDCARMIVPSGRFVTAGAALSHMDLALWLIRSVSPQLAELTARYLIVDTRPSQSAYALSDHLVHSDDVVRRFEAWARARIESGFSLVDAARSVGASERTLSRHLQAVMGKSPLAFFQTIRVERAVHLLRTTGASVDEIATQIGYGDGATLRALLRRTLGAGVREIRGKAAPVAPAEPPSSAAARVDGPTATTRVPRLAGTLRPASSAAPAAAGAQRRRS